MKREPVLPPTYLWAAIIVMVVLHSVFSVKRIIPFPWDLFGVPPLALGVALNLMADKALRDARTTVKPFQVSAALVTGGVCQVSRHPMYLGFVLILLGLAVLLGSWTPFAIVPVFAVMIDRIFVTVEERMLAERFGDSWLGYKTRVRRWV